MPLYSATASWRSTMDPSLTPHEFPSSFIAPKCSCKEGAFRKGGVILYLHPSTGPAKFEFLSHVERLELGRDSLEEWKLGEVPWLRFLNHLQLFRLHLSGEVLLPHIAGTLGALTDVVRGRSYRRVVHAPHPCLGMVRGGCI